VNTLVMGLRVLGLNFSAVFHASSEKASSRLWCVQPPPAAGELSPTPVESAALRRLGSVPPVRPPFSVVATAANVTGSLWHVGTPASPCRCGFPTWSDAVAVAASSIFAATGELNVTAARDRLTAAAALEDIACAGAPLGAGPSYATPAVVLSDAETGNTSELDADWMSAKMLATLLCLVVLTGSAGYFLPWTPSDEVAEPPVYARGLPHVLKPGENVAPSKLQEEEDAVARRRGFSVKSGHSRQLGSDLNVPFDDAEGDDFGEQK
jgi:hypothetical protein